MLTINDSTVRALILLLALLCAFSALAGAVLVHEIALLRRERRATSQDRQRLARALELAGRENRRLSQALEIAERLLGRFGLDLDPDAASKLPERPRK